MAPINHLKAIGNFFIVERNRLTLLKKKDATTSKIVMSIMMERYSDMLFLLVFSTFGMLYYMTQPGPWILMTTVALLVAMILGGFFYFKGFTWKDHLVISLQTIL